MTPEREIVVSKAGRTCKTGGLKRPLIVVKVGFPQR